MSERVRPVIDLEPLRMLVLVADLGSISAAARAEQISQPSRAGESRYWKGSWGWNSSIAEAMAPS